MTEQNKQNLIKGAVVLVAFIAVLFGIMCFATSKWWMIPAPAVGLGYGVYTFVKKYYRKD